MTVIFCNVDGVLDSDDLEGGPRGGKGLVDMVTALGLIPDRGDRESWLEDIDSGPLALVAVLFSPTSSLLARVKGLLRVTGWAGVDSVLVKVRVK